MCSNFHEIWLSGHFKISFNKVTNLIKELKNVKISKNFFFQRGTLYPVKHLIKSFFEENMFSQVLNTPLYFEMQIHYTEVGTGCARSLSEVFFNKKCRNSWSIQTRISTAESDFFFLFFLFADYNFNFSRISRCKVLVNKGASCQNLLLSPVSLICRLYSITL